jgi:tripartite motif-containing protein 71
MVYVAELYNYRMQKFNAFGELQNFWGSFGSAPGQFNSPRSVSAAPDGSILVVDKANYRVQRFAPSGGFVGQWWTNGLPFAIAADPSGIVYLTTGKFVDVHLVDGSFLGRWPVGLTTNSEAAGVAVAPDGSVYVGFASRIEKYDAAGHLLLAWGEQGSDAGQFSNFVLDLKVDGDGHVYAADYGNARIQKFSPAGVFQGQWATGCAPNGIALGNDGSIFVCCFAQIQKYAEFPTAALSTSWGRMKAAYR